MKSGEGRKVDGGGGGREKEFFSHHGHCNSLKLRSPVDFALQHEPNWISRDCIQRSTAIFALQNESEESLLLLNEMMYGPFF